jgi:hypothetical protein
MKKRIISAGLAALLAVSALSASAFADLAKADSSLKGTGITAVPILKVTLPKAMSYIINPYRLTVDAKGKAVAADDTTSAGNGQLIPVYGTTAEGTTATAWTVTNNSGIAIKTAIYATVTNGNSAAVQILDATNNNKDVADGTSAADATKRQITLNLKAGNAGIKFLNEAPTAWTTAAGCTEVASTADGASINLTLTGSTAAGAEADAVWTSKDVATINVFFKFDFIANNPTS